ncbi:MAG: hypothetical protein ABJE99_06740 [Roseobacter sp.]
MAFYLGGFNAVIARVAGTCTQGDADRLFGAALSAVLYSFVWSVMTLILTLGTIYMWRNPKQPPASSPPQSR